MKDDQENTVQGPKSVSMSNLKTNLLFISKFPTSNHHFRTAQDPKMYVDIPESNID